MSDDLDARACGARRFRDQVAIVTGAGQGIGRATARRLAQEGATVVIVDRARLPAESAVRELEQHGARAHLIVADVAQFAAARLVMDETSRAFGRIDVLVNNVGGTVWIQPYANYSEDQIRHEVDQSLWTAIGCCRAVLPVMLRQRSGAIVNVGSLSPRGIYRVPYAAAKGGVFALTTSLALEVATQGIRVNCVAPGPTAITDRVTPRNASAGEPDDQQRRWNEELQQALMHETPMRRHAQVEEQAAAIAFLASSDASFITGQILSVAGGGTIG